MSENLSQQTAITGALTARTDLFYTWSIAASGKARSKKITRDETLRAMAESARLGISKYIVPFLPQIIGLTGGGTTKLDGLLDGLVVTDVQIPFAVDLSFSDDLQRWKLRVKAVGEVADGVTLIAPVNTAFSSYIFCRMPIPNAALGNSTITLGSSTLTLGSTTTTVAGLTLTSPTLTTPALGTPASGIATNLTALNATQLTTGTVSAARMPALTGDLTTTAGAVATTLATVNANVGSFGSATASPTVTVNAKGLVTAASSTTITPAVGSITGLGTGVATALAATLDGTSGLASKAYADALVTGVLDFKGSIDASLNPNYATASKGDVYYISVAGKVGGASGKSVDVGDALIASADNAGGTEASVGTSWFVLEHNLAGALLSANNLSDVASTSTARTNLGLGSLATQSGTFSGTSSGTNTGDNAANSLYSGLVSNATHTGDATGATALTLATVATAGTTGSSTAIPVVTINAKGLTTSITTAAVVAPAGTLTGATLASGVTASSLTTVGTLQSPVMVTPALGTPSSGTLTNATGLPISTGVSGLGTGVATFLATPSSANLASAVTDETGSGSLVFATSPTLTTPISATLTSPASSNLTLGLGTGGTALTLTSSTLAATFAGAVNTGSGVTITNTGSSGLVVNNTLGNPLATFNASNADAGATNNAYIILQTANTARWYLGQSISAADGAFEIYGAAQAAASLKIAKTTGNVSIASSTAGSSGAGALVVTGGLSAGNNGNASYFGGDIAGKKLVLDVLGEQLTMTRTGVGTAVLAVGGSAELYGKAASYAFYNAAGSSSYFTIASTGAATFAGNVIVGTTSTAAKLQVSTSSSFENMSTNLQVINSSDTSYRDPDIRFWRKRSTGGATQSGDSLGGIYAGGTKSDNVSLDGDLASIVFVQSGASGASTMAKEISFSPNNGSSTFEAMRINKLGAVRMNAYGAGAATFDSSGNITSVSDARLKNITGTFTKGLAEIVKLTPKLYTWKPETGLVTDDINATLIAQDLIAAGIPEAVTTYRTVAVMEDDVQSAEDLAAGKPVTQHAKLDAAGKAVTQRVDANYSVSDRTVIAALVNAVKELKAEIDALKAAK